MNILQMMKTWTLQMGHPLINITIDSTDKTKATATQKHFLLDPKAVVKEKSPYKYVLIFLLKGQGHATVNKPVISWIYIVAHTWPLCSPQISVHGVHLH